MFRAANPTVLNDSHRLDGTIIQAIDKVTKEVPLRTFFDKLAHAARRAPRDARGADASEGGATPRQRSKGPILSISCDELRLGLTRLRVVVVEGVLARYCRVE